MESFAALLTGILLASFLAYVTIGARARAQRKDEELGGEVLFRITRRLIAVQVLQFVLAGVFLFQCILGAYTSAPASSFAVFLAGFFPLLLVISALARVRHAELREHGLILPENAPASFVPWSEVQYCKWLHSDQRFFMQLGTGDVTFAIRPRRLDAVMAVLLPRVEVRDEMGNVLNPDREPMEVDWLWKPEPPRYQFNLRTLLLFLVVASSAFAWLGIHLQARREQQAVLAKQEAALAKYEKYQPEIWRSGNSVVLLEFSLSKTPPGDADLVYLKDLPDLQFLNLTNARITDAGLVHLESLRQLDYVVLTGTQVTEDGVRKLRESLPHTKIVRESHLQFLNGVTP